MEGTFSLRQLFPQAQFFGGDDVRAGRLVCDGSQCEPGTVLAILADCEDPTEAACQALARGAVGLICEQILPVPLPQCVVTSADRAAVTLAAELLGHPADEMLMVGVVGGDGKTTTALLIAALLRAEGHRTCYETDLGAADGVVQYVPDERIADPLRMLDWLAEARDAGCAAAVLELSAETLSKPMGRTLPLDVVVVCGEVRSDRDEPLQSSLDTALECLRDGGVAIVNADSPAAVAAADRAAVPTLTFGMRQDAQVSGKIFDQQPGETTCLVTAGDVTVTLETGLTGPAMVSCQLAALTLGVLLETPLHRGVAALQAVRSIPGRMQRLAHFGAPSVVLDAGGDSARLRSVLRGLRRETGSGRLWVVAAISTTMDETDVAAAGRVAEKYAQRVVVTSCEGGKADFLPAAHAWLDGVQRTAGPQLIADRERAIAWAMREATASDTILVMGGWPRDAGPAVERAALACEVERITELQREVEDASQESSVDEPVILPHPALK